MSMSEVVTVDDRWEVVKVLRTDFNDFGKASALQIRQSITDNGHVTYSYRFGMMHDEVDGERWQPFSFIPDRYVMSYINLLKRAHGLIRDAMRSARERSDDGTVKPNLLIEEVSYIMKEKVW